ncbi:MAG TPA: regulatory iron-sulfur-containing complex subunit RicT [Oligoflexus sp.]|uniref:PSP1 domain-containing protein n=1 Tax=Oligoflexus sp. TaxID=1971216 RepID=UPI002D34E9A0|nr:regulatory iron-sulfur-containing complex subunit RicT [Oligoflexus sp.]HYX32217.1 regulatory iron-sulfur-containing complex subunit RicT [Oligoflexus sp.]
MNGINIVGVQFRRAGKIYDFDAKDFRLSIGDRVVVETERGPSLAEVKRVAYIEAEPSESLKPIVRIASRKDRDSSGRLTPEFADTFTKDKIRDLNLEMRVINVEIQFGGNKVIVYFSAPGRVDFRELVKELAGGLKTRVELKQVGARDEAKLSGGIGICGREFCCSSFLREFVPVSIKMAKNQNLALNPSKVSGGCGRLLCCLTYEDDTYTDLRHKLLPKGARVRLVDESYGDVIKGDILNQTMLVELDSGEQRSIPIKELEVVDARQGVVDDDWGSDLDFGSLMGEGDITALDDSEEVAQHRESAAEPIHGREGTRKLQPQERPARGPRENRPSNGPRPEQDAKGKGRDQQRAQPNQNQNRKPRPPRDGQPPQAKPNPNQGDRPKIAPKIIPRGQPENKGGGESGSEGSGSEGSGSES